MRSNSPAPIFSSHLLGQGIKANWQEATWSSNVPLVPVHLQPLSELSHLTCKLLTSLWPMTRDIGIMLNHLLLTSMKYL